MIYTDVKKSILKFCKDYIENNGLASKFDVFDFDAHATINELPNKDLIGIGEFSIENNSEMYTVTCYIAVCTKADDKNLARLTPVIDGLFDLLRPGHKAMDVVRQSGNTVQTLGQLVLMESVSVLPVARTETRPIQMLAIQLGSGLIDPQ